MVTVEQVLLGDELRHQADDNGCQQQTDGERQRQQGDRLHPAAGEEPRNDGTQEKEQRAVDTQRDDRIATQIGDDRHALHLLAEEHDGENPGESRKIHLKEVSRVVIRPHPQGRGGEIHRHDGQQDEQRNEFVEAVVRKEEKVVAANPEPREIERQGRHGDVDVERQFDPLPAQPESGAADQQRRGEHGREMLLAQVVDDVEQHVAVEQRDEEPDRGIEPDQFVTPEYQQQFAPAHRKAERSGQKLRNAVHQQERAEVEDQEGDEQFVDLAEQEARESLVGLEEKSRNEEIERHGETRQDRAVCEAVEGSPDVHHHYQHDTKAFGEVYEIDPPTELLFHRGKDNDFGPKWILPAEKMHAVCCRFGFFVLPLGQAIRRKTDS